MAIKDNSSNGRKRARLAADWQRAAHPQYEGNILTDQLVQQVTTTIQPMHNHHHHHHHHYHHHHHHQENNYANEWSELFDSFKNTNHLKELHCR